MYSNLNFWLSLSSLLIIVFYAVLVFRNVQPIVATAICVIIGFLFNKSTPIEMGQILQQSLSGFLALVGFIIMLGAGLGEVLSATKVSHTLVNQIVYKIGINSLFRFKIGVIVSSVVIVAILGTLAGGLAILAPILRPIAARVGLSKPSLAVLMQASGEEALILGPFAPPVVALLGVCAISYTHMLLYVSIPISCVTLITTWFMAQHLQRQYPNELLINDDTTIFIPNPRQILTTIMFLIGFIACVYYGLHTHAKTSFVIFVMLFLSLLSGVVGGISLTQIFKLLIQGMQKNLHIFFIFLLLDPLLNLVQSAGGFTALTQLFIPLEHIGGKPMLAILTGLTGAFGMPAASAAVIQMLSKIFNPAALTLQLSVTTFAFSMLLATRITNFAYPGPNMFAAMGFAESQNIKAMIKNGLTVAAVQVAFLVIYSVLFN